MAEWVAAFHGHRIISDHHSCQQLDRQNGQAAADHADHERLRRRVGERAQHPLIAPTA